MPSNIWASLHFFYLHFMLVIFNTDERNKKKTFSIDSEPEECSLYVLERFGESQPQHS